MKALLLPALAGLLTVIIANCGPGRGVEKAVAEKACAHQIELGYWEGFEGGVTKDGGKLDDAAREQGKAGLVEVIASAEYKAQLAKCTEGYAKLATPAHMDCVLAAKASSDAMACLEK